MADKVNALEIIDEVDEELSRSVKRSTVLFVDDEINILSALKRGLYKEDYKKIFASSGKEALDVIEKQEIHVLVTDMRMPGMTGLELLKQVKERYPDIVTLVLSGYTHLPQVLATVNQVDIYKFITKPWDMDEFKLIIREAVRMYNVTKENEILKISLAKKNELYQKLIKSNHEKMDILKRDMENLIASNGVTFNYVLKKYKEISQGEITAGEATLELGFIERMLKYFINTLPSESSEFSLDKLRDDLENYLINNSPEPSSNRRIKMIKSDSDRKYYRGNYRLMFVVMTVVLKYLFEVNLNGEISIAVRETAEPGSACKLVFVMTPKEKQFVSNRLRLESVLLLLTQYMRSIGGRINISEVDGNKVVIIEYTAEVIQD